MAKYFSAGDNLAKIGFLVWKNQRITRKKNRAFLLQLTWMYPEKCTNLVGWDKCKIIGQSWPITIKWFLWANILMVPSNPNDLFCRKIRIYFQPLCILTYLWIIDKCIRWALLCIFPEMSVINCQIIPTKVVKIQPIPRQIHYYMTKVLKGTNEGGKGLKGCMSEAFYKFWYCSVEDFLAFKGH